MCKAATVSTPSAREEEKDPGSDIIAPCHIVTSLWVPVQSVTPLLVFHFVSGSSLGMEPQVYAACKSGLQNWVGDQVYSPGRSGSRGQSKWEPRSTWQVDQALSRGRSSCLPIWLTWSLRVVSAHARIHKDLTNIIISH